MLAMYADPEIYSESDSAQVKARKMSREIKRERNDTSGGNRRSRKREHMIIKWLMKITHINKDMSIDFADWIQDGKVLKEVSQIIQQIRAYGVEDKYIFKVEDVVEKKRPQKVIRCLEEVAKLSKKETHIKLDTLLRNKLYT